MKDRDYQENNDERRSNQDEEPDRILKGKCLKCTFCKYSSEPMCIATTSGGIVMISNFIQNWFVLSA